MCHKNHITITFSSELNSLKIIKVCVSYSEQSFIQKDVSNADNQRTHKICNVKDDIQSRNSADDMPNENNFL